MTFIPSLTFTDYEWFPWSICKGCGMPAGNAYHSGHLVPSPFLRGLHVLWLLRPVFPNSSPIKWPTEVDFYRIENFPWSICDRCGMPAGNAYPSGHLVPFPIVGLARVPIVETRFLEFAMSLLDFSPRILLGTFSILLLTLDLHFMTSLVWLTVGHQSVYWVWLTQFLMCVLKLYCFTVSGKFCTCLSVKAHRLDVCCYAPVLLSRMRRIMRYEYTIIKFRVSFVSHCFLFPSLS